MQDTTTDHRAASPTTPALIMMTSVVAVAFFTSGFLTSRMTEETRVRARAEARFREFVSIGTYLGFVVVDRQRLDEIVCVMSEAEWEDGEAAERGEGGGQ